MGTPPGPRSLSLHDPRRREPSTNSRSSARDRLTAPALARDIFASRVPHSGMVVPSRVLGRRAVLLGLSGPFVLSLSNRRVSAGLAQAEGDEPEAARKLLALLEGRRPSDWKATEDRAKVDELIEEVANLKAPWNRKDLRGKWRLAYLQPGPDGAGVDRRIPFPEFDFNNNFQIFGADSVTNVGELLGRFLEVRVSGGLIEEDLNDVVAPKRFRANINKGELCAGQALCVPLPISGEGLFDGVYLGKRLRIGQNLNGGGARIVQVRVDL